MANCLGIYASDNLIKYAKLSMDKDKKVSLQQYGTKFILTNKTDTIRNIIAETKSENDKIVVSTANEAYERTTLFKSLSPRDLQDAIKLDYEEWCERQGVNPADFEYTYLFSDVVSGDNYNGYINIVSKKEINSLKTLPNASVSAMYSSNFTLFRLVPKDYSNYILINLGEKIYVNTTIDKKIVSIDVIDEGMKGILDKFTEVLGSYQRAYEACKSINVFSEGENVNNKDLEMILEPALQTILKKLAEIVKRQKTRVNKIVITGIGTLFTNIDILFREYFEIKTEILKSDFMNEISNVRNVAEVIETTQAISVAYEYLDPKIPSGIEYLKKAEKKSLIERFKDFNIKTIISNRNKAKSAPGAPRVKESKPLIDVQNLENYDFATTLTVLTSLSIFTGLLLFSYLLFGQIYSYQIGKIKTEYQTEISTLETETAKINDDITYIDTNKDSYKTINDNVDKTINMIESNEIGKNSTYNVAAFMQKIISIIPKNVQIKTLSSDDNKKVTIEIESTEYSGLGYFVAQLKLESVLNNVKVESITNGSKINVKIGGELP